MYLVWCASPPFQFLRGVPLRSGVTSGLFSYGLMSPKPRSRCICVVQPDAVTSRKLGDQRQRGHFHLSFLPGVSFSSYDSIYRQRQPLHGERSPYRRDILILFWPSPIGKLKIVLCSAYVQLKPRTPDEGLVPRQKPGPIEPACR